MLDDQGARHAALDPGASFVVHAPAGSGKTTLLTQRILRLLTTVEVPEQVIAITFTRKAAEEMRSRIVAALELGRGDPPTDAFRQTSYELARALLARDAALGWQLTQNPARLRIMTIDALCQQLVRQMPLAAGLVGPRSIEENAAALYREAARDALSALADADDWHGAIVHALGHLDNDWAKLEALIADMLARRDQWLRVLGRSSERVMLEASFERVVGFALSAGRVLFPDELGRELASIGDYAGRQLAAGAGGAQVALIGLAALPGAQLADLSRWQALVGLLLKADGDYRLRLDKNLGFPPGKGEPATMKARLAAVIAELSANAQARSVLARVSCLPPTLFSAGEWEVVLALAALLKRATAHLMVLGESAGKVDFTAFALAALNALGEPEQPTDLALSMDYRLQHLLIDEFQDTSATQFELVRRLTAGWTGEDGRTLFLVGDPMQSIYRFRQADVSLFMRVLSAGRLGSVPLTGLALSINFRAQACLVNWINASLPPALAIVEAFGVPFVRQIAEHGEAGPACMVYPARERAPHEEAAQVLDIVRAIRGPEPQASIAILVRSRSHLGYVTARLVEAGIAVAAREIRPLLELPIAGDLFALTRALIHEGDRIAWLAVLRAPWCGLTLASLAKLAAHDGTLRESIERTLGATDLPADEHARLKRVAPIIELAVTSLAAETLPVVVERTWLLLGGPAAFADPVQAADARAYFSLLEQVARDYALVTAERIAERLATRYSSPPAATQDAVQVMTMHRAKGLEFDHVIIPGLGRRPQAEPKRLLLWHEAIGTDDRSSLLLAPIPADGDSSLYDFLRADDQREMAAESVRLLYVAVTRARRRVHLLGHAKVDPEGRIAPEKGSFLALLWPSIEADFVANLAPAAAPLVNDVATLPSAQGVLWRYAVASLPAAPRQFDAGQISALVPQVDFEWAGSTAKYVGTVVHRLLQHVDGARNPLGDYLGYARGQLRALGVGERELDAALGRVKAAFEQTLRSERGRWLFSPDHSNSRAEWKLSHLIDGQRVHVVIDRSFVDRDGTRWIVDFKTGQHSGGGLEAYLDSEQLRYRPQLERYARIVSALDARPIRLGLYFPLLDAWREWAYDGD